MSKSDKKQIIQNYLNTNNSNISQSVIQNPKIIIKNIIDSKGEKINAYLFWIDTNISNEENKRYMKILKGNPKNLYFNIFILNLEKNKIDIIFEG